MDSNDKNKIKAKARRKDGISTGEAALEMGLETRSVGAFLQQCTKDGDLIGVGNTRRRRYFAKQEHADAYAEQIGA